MADSEQRKVVIVTGCSKGGIGFHLCEEFAAQNCVVYATARNVESIEGFKQSGIRRIAVDVTSEEDVQDAVQTVVDAEGRVDVVVNNAGVICIGPAIDISLEQAKQTFDVNFFGALRMSRAVIPHMAKRKKGVIVNVGSIVGELPTPWNGIYCASKAALHSLSQLLFMECKPFNIHVMHLAPGSVKSNLSQNHSQIFNLPPTSLYKSFLDDIVRRMYVSQSAGCMDTKVFAEKAVKRILAKRPPRYLTLGGEVWAFRLLKALPRGIALAVLWWLFSRSK